MSPTSLLHILYVFASPAAFHVHFFRTPKPPPRRRRRRRRRRVFRGRKEGRKRRLLLLRVALQKPPLDAFPPPPPLCLISREKIWAFPPTYQDAADASSSSPPAEKIHILPQARSGGTFWGTFVPFVLGTYARLTSIILGNVKKRFGLDSHSANEWFFCFHNFLFIRGFQDSVYLSSKNSCTWK